MRFAGLTMLATVAVALAGCGTTSSLQSATASDAASPAAGTTTAGSAPAAGGTVDLTRYSRLLVEDFADEATGKADAKTQAAMTIKVEAARKTFPTQIADVTRANGGFDEVVRTGSPDEKTLVMRGAVTQYREGNATLRLLVGFGAGTANFNARVQLLDGGTNELLGSWDVDKNSWILGGGIAAAQRPEDFMTEAANAIGTELSKVRKEGKFVRGSRSAAKK
jgi:hypothetical protein